MSKISKFIISAIVISLIIGVSATTLTSPWQVLGSDTGVKYPATKTTQSVAPEDDVNWANPANIGASDNQYATVTLALGQYSYRLKAQRFDFSAIPDGSTIDGILVEIERKINTAGFVCYDYRVQLLDASGALIGDNKAGAIGWTTTDTFKSYGGSSDKWNASPTAAMVKDADFGVVLSARSAWGTLIAYVDCIRVTVYYTVAPAAPTNVAATDGTYTDKVTVTWTKSDGATGYKIYENGNLLDTVGDVATWDDNTAPVPTITSGTATASDGISDEYVTLTVSEESANNGASRTYKVKAFNGAGDSADSNTDTGYRGVGALIYQWYRSSADSDGDYSILDGAITNPYDDSNGVVEPDGRYYKCYLSATGAVSQYSTWDRGYKAAPAAKGYSWGYILGA